MELVKKNVKRLVEMYECPADCKEICYKKMGKKESIYPFYRLNDEFYGIVSCKLGLKIAKELMGLKISMSISAMERGEFTEEEHVKFVMDCDECFTEMESMVKDFVFEKKKIEQTKVMHIANMEINYLLGFKLDEIGDIEGSNAVINEMCNDV